MTHNAGLELETPARKASRSLVPRSTRQAVVTLTNGRIVRGQVVIFNLPEELLVLNLADGSPSSTSALSIPFRQLTMAAFLADPSHTDSDPSFTRGSRLVMLQLVGGNEVHGVTETLAKHRPGLFLVPVDADWYERVFVPLPAIKEIIYARPLEEVVPGRSVVSLRDVQARISSREVSGGPGIGATSDPPAAASLLHGGTSKSRSTIPIGRVLVDQGFLTEAELNDIVSEQRTRGGRLGEVAVAMGLATHKMIGVALAVQFGLPFTDLADHWVDPRLREIVSPELARQWRVVPLTVRDNVLVVAVDDPTNVRSILALARHTGFQMQRSVAPASSVDRALREYDPN